MDHLTPTPRVNKNGVTVTRHMKQQTVASDDVSKAMPAPRAISLMEMKLAEKQQIRDEIFSLVVDPNSVGRDGPAQLTEYLSRVKDIGTLRKALEVANAIAESPMDEDEKRRDWYAFAGTMKTRMVDIALRNIEMIRKADSMSNGFDAITKHHIHLETRVTSYDGNPVIIENLESHFNAYQTLRFSEAYETNSGDWGNYADHYFPLVSRYPDHYKELCAYLMDRGGYKAFDEVGFEHYLSASPAIAEGAL